jgi:hypothetical protein
MNTQTNTETPTASKFHLLPRNPEASIRAQVRDIVKQAVSYVMECGETPENALKMEAVLFGDYAPCELITAEAYLCSITNDLKEHGRFMRPVIGSRDIRPKDGRDPYKIELPEVSDDTDQQVYELWVRRVGGSTTEKSNEFWSPSLVALSTKGNSPALVISQGAKLEDGVVRLENSSIYTYTVKNPATGQTTKVDLLSKINLPTNIHGLALEAARRAGFPLSEINARPARPQQSQNWQTPRSVNQGRELVTAGANGSQPVESEQFADPFADA